MQFESIVGIMEICNSFSHQIKIKGPPIWHYKKYKSNPCLESLISIVFGSQKSWIDNEKK